MTGTWTARVTAVDRPTLHLVRVALDLPDDAAPWRTTGQPDECVALGVPVPGREPARRYYTVRAVRPGGLDVELVLHGCGPATEWAARVAVGDVVTLDAPRGWYDPPADAAWLGLCGDATALPAIGRVLDERQAAGPPVHVVLSVAPDDVPDLRLRADDELLLTDDGGLVAATLGLAERPDPGYLWFAGEAAAMRAVRTRLRRDLRQPPTRWSTTAYWRRDGEAWLARLAAAGPELVDRITAVHATDEDPETQHDRYEELLDEVGLG